MDMDMDMDMDMGKEKGSSGGERVFKALFGAVVLGIVLSLLLIGHLTSTETKEAEAINSGDNLRQVMLVGRKENSVSRSLDPIGASKRRVPNGPDPIHNRHVGESQRPSGRD